MIQEEKDFDEKCKYFTCFPRANKYSTILLQIETVNILWLRTHNILKVFRFYYGFGELFPFKCFHNC